LAAWHPFATNPKVKEVAISMVKSKLVERIADQTRRLYERDVLRGLNAILDEIGAALARGERVQLHGFGAFSVRHLLARTGRNPRTGASFVVEQRRRPFFRAGKEVRRRLNPSS
jgi:integration host factor subunit beta